jgi:hypothetical protein
MNPPAPQSNESMAYGSGKPAWAQGDVESQDGLNQRRNNSGNNAGSYQRGDGGYQAPQLTGVKYAEQQTGVMEDTLRTHVQVRFAAAAQNGLCLNRSKCLSSHWLTNIVNNHRQKQQQTPSWQHFMPKDNNSKTQMTTRGKCVQMLLWLREN